MIEFLAGCLITGIIMSKEKAKSKYNGEPFTRFKLMPQGFGWARGKYESLEIGQKVAFKLGDYNKIINVKEL